MLLSTLLKELNYEQSVYYHTDISEFESETAHLFRAALHIGVNGIYVFKTSPDIEFPNAKYKVIADRPAVYVAQAENSKQAQNIHRSLWNLGYAPFLLVLLPDQINVYTGFDYSEKDNKRGLLDEIPLDEIRKLLVDFSAEAIDTGHIWQTKKYRNQIDQRQRVDRRLLENLRQLGEQLSKRELPPQIAHALIGKYVYIRYLWDRGILTEEWLREQQISRESVFGRMATAEGLSKLTNALETRFNGKIFPLNFENPDAPKDQHVRLTASVFLGDEIISSTEEEIIQQLHLEFQAYDFAYIPVEILSAVYEQFIEDSESSGAVYTPEVLADFLLSEMHSVKPLTKELRILDPACGSGIFLVLAYRRLIESELAKIDKANLSPEALKELLSTLLSNLFGVERELDACYVTEFSLILTFLNYLDPRELEKLKFHFPDLHNKQIFHSDFFDLDGTHYDGKFWQQELRFDWIVGNPPWIELKDDTRGEELVRKWMDDRTNKAQRPVSGKRVAEAFSWLVIDLLNSEGVIGLILPATSLFNLEARKYRRHFFTKNQVFQITNFANLREVLFPKNEFPAFTAIYRPDDSIRDRLPIIHYAPLSVDQITGVQERPWVITVNEKEIQEVNPYDARTGETVVWKLALWGTFQDKKALERIKALFPSTLMDICSSRKWPFFQGVELRHVDLSAKYKPKAAPELKGKKRFLSDAMRSSLFRFSVPQNVLRDIPDEMCYIRERGGEAGLLLTPAPHIILSPVWHSYVTFSDTDFLIPPRQMGIAGPKEDADRLRALSIYINSSLVSYYLFFHSQQWGVFRQARLVSIAEVRKVPTPALTPVQIEELADLHRGLVKAEEQQILEVLSRSRNMQPDLLTFDYPESSSLDTQLEWFSKLSPSRKRQINREISLLRETLQKSVDEKIFDLFEIPDDIRLLVTEFVQVRLSLDKAKAINRVIRKPSEQELLDYARELRDELDNFVTGQTHHGITITYSPEIIECVIEITDSDTPIALNSSSVRRGNLTSSLILSDLSESIREQVSQWIYVQRGLRLFDGPRIHLYKSPRLIDWTRTQAMNDAGDLVEDVVASF